MRIITRAVVNERMDVKVDIAPEILAELEQKEDQANALALSLMAKENELEQAQGHLQVLVLHELQPACGHIPLQKMSGRVQLVQLACMHALVTALCAANLSHLLEQYCGKLSLPRGPRSTVLAFACQTRACCENDRHCPAAALRTLTHDRQVSGLRVVIVKHSHAHMPI